VAALNGVGVDYHAAEQAMMMLAFVLYLALFPQPVCGGSRWYWRSAAS
jgi:hypothetical protein